MSYSQPEQYVASRHQAIAYGGAIEWEELPSLADALSPRLVARDSRARGADNTTSVLEPAASYRAPWNATMPAEFDRIPPSGPFLEALKGLSMREVKEPGVFQHFFGPQAQSR